MNKITPFGNNILVKPTVEPTILQSADGYLCEYGEVLAIGDTVEHIKVGDIIAYVKWGTKNIDVKGEKIWFIPEDDRFVLGKFSMS